MEATGGNIFAYPILPQKKSSKIFNYFSGIYFVHSVPIYNNGKLLGLSSVMYFSVFLLLSLAVY